MAKARTLLVCFVILMLSTQVSAQRNDTSPLNNIVGLLGSLFTNATQDNGTSNGENPLSGILQNIVGSLSNSSFFEQILGSLSGGDSVSNATQDNGTSNGENPLSGIIKNIVGSISNSTFFEQILGCLSGGDKVSPDKNQGLDINSLLKLVQPGGFSMEQAKQALYMYQPILSNSLTARGVGETCKNDFFLTLQGLLDRQMWALKMIDAFGKPRNGLLEGQLKWTGSYDECKEVKAVAYNNSEAVEQFTGKYCAAGIPVAGLPSALSSLLPPGTYLYVGTCVSQSCSGQEVSGIVNTVLEFAQVQMPAGSFFNCAKEKKLETDAIAVLCFLSVLGSIVVLGTLYDVMYVQLRSEDSEAKIPGPITNGTYHASKPVLTYCKQPIDRPHAYYEVQANNGYTNGGYTVTEIANGGTREMETTLQYDKENDKPVGASDVNIAINNGTNEIVTPQKAPKQRGMVEQILLSFSAYTNGVKILSTNQGSGSLGAVNGIRFLSMCWVILGHTYFIALGLDDNLFPYFGRKMKSLTFMALPYASVSVDSFFALSGILVAYLSLKELKKVGGALKLNWFMFYFHRFWRLTPPYMLVIMVGTVILPYTYSGPFWREGEFPGMTNCRDNWWTNLLYVNNYVKADKMCLGWSWYLANDMQFYVISPFILLPLFYNFIAGGISCLIFLIATISATAVINQRHHYPSQTIDEYAPKPLDRDYMVNLYFPSYARMGPYVIGLFTGYVLYRWKCKCRIPKIVNPICWFVCISTCCVLVYSLYNEGDSNIFSVERSTAFNALSRTVWGICVCWIVFACACGYGGWINQILSWKAFIPLGRLTYCAYLVHPLVMLMFYISRNRPTYFTDYETAYLFIGHLVMSYGVAFIVSLFFESPMMGLEKAIFKKK